MMISNFGKFGQQRNGTQGCWWPRGSGHSYIFGAGPWFGTIDQTVGDTMVTIGYGPHGGEAEFQPGLAGWTVSDPKAIIYMYPGNWPVPVTSYPMAPAVTPKSQQDSWCAYNDLDVVYHMTGDTRPIGIEVYQACYAWNLPILGDAIFIQYIFKNVSGKKLTKCYFGIAADCDIGNESGQGNDISTCILGRWYRFPGSPDSIWVDDVAFQWQEVEEPGWNPSVPGVMGFDLFQTAFDLVSGQDKDNDSIPDQYEQDSEYYVTNLPLEKWDVNSNAVPDWRDPAEIPQYGMTAYKLFTLNFEPNRDNERYMTMAGINFKTGAYEPFDTVPPAPDDQRFLMSSGPFDLEPGASATIVLGVVFANWDSIYGTPDSALAPVDNYCQYVFDMNWLVPGPPPSPTLTCIPGDKKVTLVWNNISEVTPDPYYEIVHNAPPFLPMHDPYYLRFDFQGFRIWKSLTGRVSEWNLVTTYDKADGITFSSGIPFVPESLWIHATDNGLVHSFVDTDVRNGFNYYYAVTAFDYNFVKSLFDSVFIDTFYVDTLDHDTTFVYDTVWVGGPLRIISESGQFGVSAVPRRDPANYVASACARATVWGHPFLADSNIAIAMTYPFDMTTDSVFVDFRPVLFDSVTYDPKYTICLSGADHAVVDSVQVIMDPITAATVDHQFALYKGMNITGRFIHDALSTQTSVFDRVEVNTGTYPVAKLTSPPISSSFNFWAYRGNNYQITWKSSHGATSGPANTIEVLDLTLNQAVPYGAYKDSTTHYYDKNANGWCFRSLRTFSDTLVLYGSPAAQWNTKQVYLLGGMFNLNAGGPLTPAGDLPQVGDVWTVYANPDYQHPAPAYATVALLPQPAYLDTLMKLTLNVKAVPNPYIVNNEWQRSSLIRRMRFINLPGRCTIRIFNLNGELVKTILHTETITPAGGTEVKNNAGGDEWWDLLSENRQLIASGVYVFHIESSVGEQVGKFAVIQ
jgi:hypothetical protein